MVADNCAMIVKRHSMYQLMLNIIYLDLLCCLHVKTLSGDNDTTFDYQYVINVPDFYHL